jgi:hypothetical protein
MSLSEGEIFKWPFNSSTRIDPACRIKYEIIALQFTTFRAFGKIMRTQNLPPQAHFLGLIPYPKPGSSGHPFEATSGGNLELEFGTTFAIYPGSEHHWL